MCTATPTTGGPQSDHQYVLAELAIDSEVEELTMFRVENHGSIVLVRPETEGEHEWLEQTAPEDAQWWGDALVVEPRYVAGVLEAARNDGFDIGD